MLKTIFGAEEMSIGMKDKTIWFEIERYVESTK